MEVMIGIDVLTALMGEVIEIVATRIIEAIALNLEKHPDEIRNLIPDFTREITKRILILSFEIADNAQVFYANIEESFKDLISEAQVEYLVNKAKADEGTELQID